MNRSEALSILHEYVKNENLVRHMLAVESAMCFYAVKLGENAEELRHVFLFLPGDVEHA